MTPDYILLEFIFYWFEIYPEKPSVKNYQVKYMAFYFFMLINFMIRAMYYYTLRQAAIFIHVFKNHG